MRFTYISIILLFFLSLSIHAQQLPEATATYTNTPPRIDGQLNDDTWITSQSIEQFAQYTPNYHQSPTQRTSVKIVYDNHAIYIAAQMHDTAPDSILKQLGNRDDGLNADYFGIRFDTYNNQQDCYTFEVFASGVQKDWRLQDWSYNGVWRSATQITDQGWNVEIKIPFSAFRFPPLKIQEWGMQMYRSIRRNREFDQWALEEKGASNSLNYWGKLKGIHNITPPLRLALIPYLSAGANHLDDKDATTNDLSSAYGGGMDVRYGVNESYTLDVTLLPDFSQVKSDNPVKNLSAFETVHGENREFFRTSVSMFHKGGLFYSRRIGQKPRHHDAISDSLQNGDEITDNPSNSRLINAFKISGRNENGLAIGTLNAITANTWSVITDSIGTKRKILTEPASNYNITIIDKALKNNSSIYLINTNVSRAKHYGMANVTGSGASFCDHSHNYRFSATGVLSQRVNNTPETDQPTNHLDLGYRYNLSLQKIKGNFHFNLYRNLNDEKYNINDLGINHTNNFINNGINLSYDFYEPIWIFRNFRSSISLDQRLNFITRKNLNTTFNYNGGGTFDNYISFWYSFQQALDKRYDYYEPRTDGRYILKPSYASGNMGFSSDYRRPLAVDCSFSLTQDDADAKNYGVAINPVIRISDKLSFNHRIYFGEQINNRGYIDNDTTAIIFGQRDITTLENSFSSRYMVRNNLSLSIWMRHYWYQGTYNEYFDLKNDGELAENNHYPGKDNFNFNSFNLDLVLGWQFAPGSSMNLMWKNSLQNEDNTIINNLIDDIEHTFTIPQKNNISFRFLYYLDYQQLQKHKKSTSISA